MQLDPNLIEEAFKQGKITQQTRDALVGNSSASPMMATVNSMQSSAAPAPVAPIPQAAPAPQPIAAAPAVPEVPMAPKTSTVQVESGRKETTTTSGKIKSPDMVQAEGMFDSAIAGQKESNKAQAEVATKKAAEQFNLEQEKARIQGEAVQKRDEVAQKAFDEQQARLTQIDKDVETLKNQEYKGFWSDKSTGTKIVGALSMALGAFGAAKAGGPNYAMNIIQDAMDRDFSTYKTNIDKQISVIQQSRLNMDAKDKLTQQKLSQLDAFKIGQLEQVQTKIGALASKFGGEEAQAKLMGINAQLDQQKADKKMEIADRYAQQYSKTVEKDIRTLHVDEQGNVMGGNEKAQYEMLPKDRQKQIDQLAETSAKLAAGNSKINKALEQLKNPNLSRDDKIRAGQALLEDLVSTGAVQKEEAERYGAELESNWGKIGTGATKGAAAGAAIGGGIGVLAAGAGAIPGAAIGAGAAAILGGVAGLVDAANDPGGIRFKGDPEGFAKRVELIQAKNDAAIRLNEKVNQYMRRGMGLVEAQSRAEHDLSSELMGKAKETPPPPKQEEPKTPLYDMVKGSIF